MIFVILILLTGSETAERTYETVFVHEWGVVLIDEVIPTAMGAERGYLEENGMLESYYPMIVDAPVIWFHGPEFTGTLTVEVKNGYFSLLIPLPAVISTCNDEIPIVRDEENYLAVWKNLSFTDEVSMPGDRPVDGRVVPDESPEEGFRWAMPFWRRVPALTVEYEPASYIDRFIYYECSASNLFEEHNPIESYEGSSIAFYEKDGQLMANLLTAPGNRICFELSLSEEGIMDILSGWGNNEFLDEEIKALWNTWKPSISTRCLMNGETVVLFPLTDEQVESISTLSLETDQGFHVEYSRLFLAMGTV